MAKRKENYIIGIDEVGRGALAGPVVVAAVALQKISNIKYKKLKIPLRDSKRLSSRQREIWFEYIKENQNLFYATASMPPKLIDKINISQAANLAATRALEKITKNLKLRTKNCQVLLDGGLYLKKPKTTNQKSKTIIKGDEKIPVVMLASIVAKVTRDRRMKKLHKKYPQYDFINNVGYGTKKHLRAIRKHGRLPLHRKSFKIK